MVFGTRTRRREWRRAADESGFTIVELLVAALVALSLSAVLLDGLGAQLSLSRVQPAVVDIVQRARAAAEVVAADLMMAGAGIDEGPDAGGLVCCLPPVSPRRIGLRSADPGGTARSDVVTVTFGAAGAEGARLQAALAGPSPALSLIPGPPCPAVALCGLADEDSVVVFDGREHHDYYRLSAPVGGPASLVPRQAAPGSAYAIGARVAKVETHTYYLDAALRQLRHYDGYLSDVPAVDNVLSVAFEYWGEDRPPLYPRPPLGVANCLYDAAGTGLSWSGAALGMTDRLVTIPLSQFRDGPWCGTGDNRFDADLLRIRRVRMTVVLQGPDELRGRGSLFARPGVSRSALRLVPDLSFALDVTPRNLNAGR